jgi:hypothetical protein
MKKQQPAWQDTADFHLKWFFASLAGIIFSLRFISIKKIMQNVTKSRK